MPAPPGVVFFNDVVGWGGTERYLHMLAAGLRKRGTTVLVVVPPVPRGPGDLGAFLARFRESGVPVRLVPRPRTNIGRIPWAYRLYRKLSRSLGRDLILHFNQAVPGAHLLEIIGARLAGIGTLISTNHLPVLGPSHEPLHRIVGILPKRCIDLTIVESTTNREIALANRLADDTKTVVVVHGIRLSEVAAAAGAAPSKEQLGLSESGFVIGSVGQLTQQKAYPHLLEALRIMRWEYRTDASLLIIGAGPERSDLERSVDRLKLRGHVRLLGHRDDLYGLLHAFDVFALSSDFEGLPLAILEAMAAGKPVVATDVGGVHDAVTHGQTGFLVPRGDADALARALHALARDNALREQMGARAAAFAAARFDSERMVTETLDAYAMAVSRARRFRRRGLVSIPRSRLGAHVQRRKDKGMGTYL